jgi:TonB family protein
MFNKADVAYYSPSEYLPPLDTRRSRSTQARKADPEYSAQPIISVPPEADNHSQTIVSAPNVKLHSDVTLPNTVAWSDKPRMPIAPAPLVNASETSRLAPQVDRSVIAPPPDIRDTTQQSVQALQSDVIAPPPALEADSRRKIGDIDMGRSDVIAPAPQLAVDAQRTVRSRGLQSGSPQVIAPPPALGASGGSRSAATIALSLHPAVGAPPAAVAGNRRGSFAATPEGHHGASGDAGGSGGGTSKNGSDASAKSAGNLPAGLYVGKSGNATASVAGGPGATSSGNDVNPRLLAGMRPPSVTRPQPEKQRNTSEIERSVFGDRKVYSLFLNMPNLNSGGGSWIIRFAALKTDAGASADNAASAELSAPVATTKVDPAYPLQLMRQNVAGTVILYAIIHADGTVGSVRVLRSVDERLDRFAGEAISKWQFQPAARNGTPVDVEATFWIPFRPGKIPSNF